MPIADAGILGIVRLIGAAHQTRPGVHTQGDVTLQTDGAGREHATRHHHAAAAGGVAGVDSGLYRRGRERLAAGTRPVVKHIEFDAARGQQRHLHAIQEHTAIHG